MDEELDRKKAELEKLNQHLEQVKQLRPAVAPEAKVPNQAARAAIDFASATAVGTVLGYGMDRWLGTLPWGLLVGLFIGTAAGLKMLFQVLAESPAAEPKKND